MFRIKAQHSDITGNKARKKMTEENLMYEPVTDDLLKVFLSL